MLSGLDVVSPGFDPSLGGTPESCWRSLEQKRWAPSAGPLLVVAPHPDDETLGAGGLIYTWSRHRQPVTIISVTDGEAACPEVIDLASIRCRELQAALRCLGVDEANIIRLRVPDGRVGQFRPLLAEAIASAVTPATTLIAPFDRDGHPDHDAAGAVALEVAHKHRTPLGAYPIWAWHQATPRIFSGLRTVRFTLSAAARAAKHAAIQRHASQLRQRPGGAIVPAHVLAYFKRSYETFVLWAPQGGRRAQSNPRIGN